MKSIELGDYDTFSGCPAFFVAVFAVFLTFIFTGDLYLLPLSNA